MRPPTIRELGKRLGCVSTNAIACFVDSLRSKGMLEPSTRATTGVTATRDLALTPAGLAAIGRTDMSVTEAAAAYVFDRAEQHHPSTGIHDALCVIAAALAEGEHLKARDHGELDDLLSRVRGIARRAL